MACFFNRVSLSISGVFFIINIIKEVSKVVKLFSFMFFFLFSCLGINNLQATYESGHVIVIHSDLKSKKKYVIFGLTKKHKLSTFGGLRDHGEMNPKDTAAREAEEETLGVLGNKTTFRKMLISVSAISKKKDGHFCYVLPSKNYGDLLHLSHKFKEIRFDKTKKLPYCQREIIDLVAVEVDLLRKKVFNGDKFEFRDNSGKMRSVRVKNVLIDAIQNGYLDNL